jgi:hypothetical protein
MEGGEAAGQRGLVEGSDQSWRCKEKITWEIGWGRMRGIGRAAVNEAGK